MIVVLHGALGSHHQFQPLLETLEDKAVFLELPGHGGTPDVDLPWSIRMFSERVEQFFENEGYAETKIFGYSMGGYIALDLARRRPELVRSIVTLGTKLNWSPEIALKETSRLNPDVIESKVPAFAKDLMERHGADNWKNVLAKTAQLMLDIGNNPPLTVENVADVGATVRFGIGDRDEMVTIEETLAFFRSTPNAEFTVLPGTRHPIETVKVRLILDLIRPLRM
ncbi:MAG: alpha/beta fold hydrolase [Ignavibacteria bacterium]|nr:alpha/beta fold hydrolase [Ignavibacteria bacterium]